MPRNYIKKTSGSRYTKDDLKKAILEVKNGSTIYTASKKFSVPEETVRRWVFKSPSHQEQGRSSYLIKEEMCTVVVALQFSEHCGFPFDRRDVINLVETYLTSNKAAQLLFANRKSGVEWIRGFKKRKLSKKKPELLAQVFSSKDSG
ncbi:uncharacterized protein TNCV_4442971 [Trichonephila clavipes]|nr:uncharacterized protein TNCV_4442971 [Trichonephila clavipes]